MKRTFSIPPKLTFAVQMAFMVLWLSNLAGTDAYYSVYALCGFAGALCLMDNYRGRNGGIGKPKIRASWVILSAVFSLAVILANYPVFLQIRDPYDVSAETNLFMNVVEMACSFLGGTFVALNGILWLMERYPATGTGWKRDPFRGAPWKVFACSFGIILAVYFLYLFLTVYPGNLTLDSMNQVDQIYAGEYVNNHPFWHTMLIKLFLELGYALFRDANAAVATFSAAQAVIMAAVFSYGLVTLYQMGISWLWIGVAFAMYAFLPHNITYSATMWKDVVFGYSLALMVIALLRCLRGVGKNRKLNYALLVLGGFLFCIMRTNGWYTMLLAALVLIPCLWKSHRRIVLALVAVMTAGWIMIGPMLTVLNVGETDFVEALSMPLQQISRVIADGCELTENETEMLEKILDLEEVPALYNSGLSDPIKNEVRENDTEYLRTHLTEYARLWLKLGLQYPGEYAKGWIDQTKGYWNGGYDRDIYAHYVHENDYGMAVSVGSNIVCKLMKAYLTFVREAVVFQPLQSIGLHMWIMALLCFVNAAGKRKEWLICMPSLMVIFGLLIGTPVYAEFRYAYPLFTVFPFAVPVLLNRPAEE